MIGFSLAMKALSFFPRQQVAAFARKALALLATTAEGATTNLLEHDGEVIAFTAIDNFLAKIEAGTEAATPAAPAAPTTPNAPTPPAAS